MHVPFPPSANTIPYRDRESAGRWLAAELEKYAEAGSLLLALPRGGVIVGAEIARALQAPLRVFVVRKIQVGEESRSIGALASGGVCVLNQETVNTTELGNAEISAAVARARGELLDWENKFPRFKMPAEIAGRNVILIDDGAASGGSLRAAVAALRPQRPSRIVVATAVASREAVELLRKEADEIICPSIPEPFFSIGLAFERFPILTDQEVARALDSTPSP